MVDWSAIGANEPMQDGKPVFWQGDALREKLEAIAVIAATFRIMYTGPGDEEDCALTTIYALANAALENIPDNNTNNENKERIVA